MPMISVNAAAEILQVTPRRVRAMLKTYPHLGFKIGGTWVLSEHAVAAHAAKENRPGRPRKRPVKKKK